MTLWINLWCDKKRNVELKLLDPCSKAGMTLKILLLHNTTNSHLGSHYLTHLHWKKLSNYFSGRLDDLKLAVDCLQGKSPEEKYPYDICSVIPALPNIPVLFLFNDADDFMPAKAMLLYERRAEYFLDGECRVMVDWCLFEYLKQKIT